MARRPDRYGSFSALRECEIAGADYRIRFEDRSSHVAILAPHGGFIEPATSQIAEQVAAESFSLYSFEGLDADRLHHELHITSEHFDEPIALGLVSRSRIVLAIHGRTDRDDPETSWVGGLDGPLRDLIVQALRQGGFAAAPRKKGEALAGASAANICNRGRRKAGVQLEIPRWMRDTLMSDAGKLGRYARSVRSAIERYDEALGAD